jgi:DNA-binding CsgD family transcriptional regulator
MPTRPTLTTLVAYGVIAGLTLACLMLVSLSPLAFDWGRELMAAVVALLGVLVGVRLYRRTHPVDRAAAENPVDASATIAALSMREREVLALLAGGLTNKELARRLNVSENTVKTHLANVYEKLGVGGRVQAVMAAQRLGAQFSSPFKGGEAGIREAQLRAAAAGSPCKANRGPEGAGRRMGPDTAARTPSPPQPSP